MDFLKRCQFSFLLILICLNSACGKGNFNRLFERNEQLDDIDYLMDEAEYAYDQEDFEKAEQLAKKAYNIQENERASVLLAYIYLSFAKLDIFQLSKSLSNDDADEKEDKTSSKTNNLFNLIARSLDITNADFIKLSSETLPGTPVVYEPKNLEQARKSDVETLAYIGKAVTILCPFVADGAKIIGENKDARHECEESEYQTNYSTTGAFAWALAHLGEAITFYSTLLYTSPNETRPNLLTRTSNLSQYKSNPKEYLNEISSLSEIIKAILPTDPEKAAGSMLYGLFSNLQTTNLALEVSGAPKQITEKVTRVIDEIQSGIKDISDISQANTAMRDKLVKSLQGELSKQISDIEAGEEDLAQICEKYKDIDTAGSKIPANC